MTTFGDEEQDDHRPAAAREGQQTAAQNRWGGRVILALQSAYDKMLAGRLRQLQSQVIEQDREISQLARDLAQMSTQVEQMNRRLLDLEEETAGEETPATDDEIE